jgi:hypothetical protein
LGTYWLLRKRRRCHQLVPDSGGICYLIARVFDDAGNGQFTSVINEGIDWAIDQGADVINMSLGGGGFSQTGQNLFYKAHILGVLSVASAGNNGNTQLSYPASYDNVISVAAVDQNKKRASFSQSNNEVDISAAGVRVSHPLGNRYAYQGRAGPPTCGRYCKDLVHVHAPTTVGECLPARLRTMLSVET